MDNTTSSNISKLKQLFVKYSSAEELLIISNAYLAAIFDNASDAILAKSMDRVITAWNPAAERLYGWSQEEAIGKDVSIIIPDEKLDELDMVMDSLAKGKKIAPLQTIRKTKDGRKIDVLVTISPILDRTGNIIGASSIAHPQIKG